MSGIARQVYVVSDIHIGGEYASSGDKDDRGFRISVHIPRFTSFIRALAGKPANGTLTELVINGDFIDFLAEKEASGGEWNAFTANPDLAVEKLENIVARDREVFDALQALIDNGHALTILLGNHDIELALPQVRRRLMALLGVNSAHKFLFIYDGEAYVIGDALIEHGNRYDKFNVVNHDLLRRVRSLQSRNQDVPVEHQFEAPPGSTIVASVMNPIKLDYPFIDLLKPETEAAIPVLLALEPGTRSKLGKIAGVAMRAHKHRMAGDALPGFGGDIKSTDEIAEFGDDISAGEDWSADAMSTDVEQEGDPLREVLSQSFGDDAQEFLADLDAATDADLDIGEDISASDTFDRQWGLLGLLLSRKDADVERRLPNLLKALRILSQDKSFDRGVETASEYLDAATELSRLGFRCVVFGHTHLPKYIPLGEDAVYINSGTWADFMKFPADMLSGPEEQAISGLRNFMSDLQAGALSKWVGFEPTYARLDFDLADKLLQADLCDFPECGTV